ncbi:probable trehalose-phosphate phosphatase J isoform X1 [Trifolium pratense]|nr:probable trehalose-phosphate phosphatase J isoform X1 [Trifolium pratense]
MTQQNVVVSETKTGINSGGSTITVAQKPPAAPGYIPIPRRRILKNLEINGGQRINTWIDSMRASSPTHVKSTPSLAEEYNSWILRHPSALDMFEQIMDASKGKQIVMFLDYDGTLSPIVDDPDRALMSESMRKTVRQLARCFPTAIVTGRCIDKVYNFVRLAELYYAGSHGMDIKGPTKESKYNKNKKAEEILFQPAREFVPMINEVYEQLVEKTKLTPGARVENHKFCASVHFRCVEEKRWVELAEQVKSVIKEYPKLRLTQGRKVGHCSIYFFYNYYYFFFGGGVIFFMVGCDLISSKVIMTGIKNNINKRCLTFNVNCLIQVLEIRPAIKWDKGKALEFLLESLGFANCNDVFPVYIGDDRTDEDAFKKLRDRGQGFGILVSKFPKDTTASYSLQEPNEVMDFLQRLVEWKKVSTRSRSRV